MIWEYFLFALLFLMLWLESKQGSKYNPRTGKLKARNKKEAIHEQRHAAQDKAGWLDIDSALTEAALFTVLILAALRNDPVLLAPCFIALMVSWGLEIDANLHFLPLAGSGGNKRLKK